MSYLSTVGSLVLAGALVACAPTPTSRGTGQVVDDATVTARVKTEIAQTQGLEGAAQINVDTYRGVVSLAGFVNSGEQARAAAMAASRVPGVMEVKNNLEIKPAQ